MDINIESKFRLFERNFQELKKMYRFDGFMIILPALAATLESITIDPNRVALCRDIIKEKSSVFSPFRATSNKLIAVRLSLCQNPENTFDRILDIYSRLRKQFSSSEYLANVAFTLQSNFGEIDIDKVALDAAIIFDSFKQNHRFLTGNEDASSAVLMALTQNDPKEMIKDMEECYLLLKEIFRAGNHTHSMAQVLSFADGNPKEKTKKTIELFDKLSEKGLKMTKDMNVAILGIFSLIDHDADETAGLIQQVHDELKNIKGLGSFSVSKSMRIMLSSVIVYSSLNSGGNDLLIESSSALIINIYTTLIMLLITNSAAITAASAGAANG